MTTSSLSGDSLWESLTSGTFFEKKKPATSKRKKRQAKKASGNPQFNAILAELEALKVSAPRSPWRAVAMVLPISEVHCACGAIYTSPNAKPLVRFLHSRTGDIQETADHPAALRPSLPKQTRVLRTSSEFCPACFQATEGRSDQPGQLDLWEESDAHRPWQHPLAKPVGLAYRTDATPASPAYRPQREFITSPKCVTCTKAFPIQVLGPVIRIQED